METYYVFTRAPGVTMMKIHQMAKILKVPVLQQDEMCYPMKQHKDMHFQSALECLKDFIDNTARGDIEMTETSIGQVEIVCWEYHGQDAIIRVVEIGFGKMDGQMLPFGYSYSRTRRESYIYNVFGDMLFTLQDTEDLFAIEDTELEEAILHEIYSICDGDLGFLEI